jgi:hypothetical protein
MKLKRKRLNKMENNISKKSNNHNQRQNKLYNHNLLNKKDQINKRIHNNS